MSRDDLESCTPFEFEVIYHGWFERETRMHHESWYQTRFMVTCMLAPFSSKELRPDDIVRFPWEENLHEEKVRKSSRERMKEIEERVIKHENHSRVSDSPSL